MTRKWKAAAVVGVGLIATALSGGILQAQSPLTAQDLYSKLSARAMDGDAEAKKLQAEVDQYVRSHGISIADLGVPARAATSDRGSGVARVRVEATGQWIVEITSDPDLDSADAVAAYVALRHSSLATLAADAPGREIRVAISTRRQYSLPGFGASFCAAGCRLESLVVDVYGPRGWVMSSGRQLQGASPAAAESLETTMLDQVSASLDQYTDLDPATLTLAVRQAVVTMPAEAALKASKAPDVLAVDPLSDLEDGYSGTAARVVAKAGPDLYAAYTTLVLGETITPAYEPTKSGETK